MTYDPGLPRHVGDDAMVAERIRLARQSAALEARRRDREPSLPFATYVARGLDVLLGLAEVQPFASTPRTEPEKPLRCMLGFHSVHVATTGRAGFVRFLQCRRAGCDWSAIRKGR